MYLRATPTVHAGLQYACMGSHLICCSHFCNEYAGEPSREEQLIIALGLGGRGQHIDAPRGNSQQ